MNRYFLRIMIILLIPFFGGCLSTKNVNLSETGTLFNNNRSFDAREVEAMRILRLNIDRIELRPEDITRLQDLLETNMFFVPNPEASQKQEPINTDNLPSFGKQEYDENRMRRPSPPPPAPSRRETQVRILEIQAVIRLLSRDYSPRTFLLILEQLSYPMPEEELSPNQAIREEDRDMYHPIREEALRYVYSADAEMYPYVWQIIQSGRLPPQMSARLVPFFRRVPHGAVYLFTLLQREETVIVDTVVQELASIYPDHNNPQLKEILDPARFNQHIAGPWIFSYEDSDAFILGINLMNSPDPKVQEATKRALFRRPTPWLTQEAVNTLDTPQTPAVRMLLIEFLARQNHPLSLYFIHELLLHPQSSVRSFAHQFIITADATYYPYLIEHLTNPDTPEPLLLALMPYTLNFLRLSTAEVMLPLLDHPTSAVSVQSQQFFRQIIQQTNIQELLLETYRQNLTAKASTLFIMELFMSNGLTQIITYGKTEKELVYEPSLFFLLTHANDDLWQTSITQAKPATLQVFLNRIVDLQRLIQSSRGIDQTNNIIQISKELTEVNRKLQGQREEQQRLFNQIINNRDNNQSLDNTQELRHQRDQLTVALRQNFSRGNAQQKEAFLRYQSIIQEINTSLLSLRVDQRPIAETLLRRAGLSTEWIQSFQMLPPL
ncbi:hypothetical protein [Entomospira culicis]|uniref:Uncharacterized protein n=1 Tax=Entomospira culicis TaxID=2719989 RepID=A0A968GGL2_9SPIO|nr:hypothetical protein [Entomospira culicis]NIZ18456.1 hypothetical protein [Entomospira culicis]NIZ68672.1 hypothetical protein [Entomospira culicis]WDI37271.1 hypothetical protein PVA46_00330 [Entomospira culicis]WDI38900.1 hypothetical protein PVA47_00340 [Entomospira culicis]